MAKTTLTNYLRRIQRQGRTDELTKRLRRAFKVTGLKAEAQAKLNATKRPRSRSGKLRQSIVHKVRKSTARDGVELALRAGGRVRGKTVEYAGAQENGATITGNLAIPLDDAIIDPDTRQTKYPTARMVPDLFLIRVNGKAFLVRKSGERLEFWYILKRTVTIPATHFLMRGLKSQVPDFRRRVLSELEQMLEVRG